MELLRFLHIAMGAISTLPPPPPPPSYSLPCSFGALQTYFLLSSPSDVPDLITTLEDPAIPFSSLSRIPTPSPFFDGSSLFKLFSRQALSNHTLDLLFR